jgi:hypothetical protein
MSGWDDMEAEIWDGTGTVLDRVPSGGWIDDEQADWDEGGEDDE